VEISREQVFPVLYDGKLRVYPVSVFLVVGNWDRFMRSFGKFFMKFPYGDSSLMRLKSMILNVMYPTFSGHAAGGAVG
jgi:hypothetical protein